MTDADFARKQELLRQAMRVDVPNRAPREGVETEHEIALGFWTRLIKAMLRKVRGRE